ncbi:MAG: FHA domain-containing protein [Bdellovibrionales bacterium]|nr:FHA domain-containing protein [Bdellovibrionales bacterium]
MSKKSSLEWAELTQNTIRPWSIEVLDHKQEHLHLCALNDTVTYIGRMPENQIVLDDPKVSRSHAKITCLGGHYFIEDQQSENGILINGKSTLKQELQLGDRISIGDHILRVTDQVVDTSTKPLQEFDEENLNERTISIQEAYVGVCDATIVLNIHGKRHMHKIQFSDEEIIKFFHEHELRLTLVVQTKSDLLKKSFTLSNT